MAPREHQEAIGLDRRTVVAEDFRALFEAMPAACLVITPDVPRYTIVAATDAYCRYAQISRETVLGRGLFEVFPDDGAFSALGAGQRRVQVALRDSFAKVYRTRVADRMAIQRYDLPGRDGRLEPRYWQPIYAPVFAPGGAVRYLEHQPGGGRHRARRGRGVPAGNGWPHGRR